MRKVNKKKMRTTRKKKQNKYNKKKSLSKSRCLSLYNRITRKRINKGGS